MMMCGRVDKKNLCNIQAWHRYTRFEQRLLAALADVYVCIREILQHDDEWESGQ